MSYDKGICDTSFSTRLEEPNRAQQKCMTGESYISSADLGLVPCVSLGILLSDDWVVSQQDSVDRIKKESKRIEERKVKRESCCTGGKKRKTRGA
jgi:hypothetical protein